MMIFRRAPSFLAMFVTLVMAAVAAAAALLLFWRRTSWRVQPVRVVVLGEVVLVPWAVVGSIPTTIDLVDVRF